MATVDAASKENESLFHQTQKHKSLFGGTNLPRHGSEVEKLHCIKEVLCGNLFIATEHSEDIILDGNARKLKIRPGRFGKESVHVITFPKADEALQIYLPTLKKMLYLHHENILWQYFTEDRDHCFIAIKPVELTLRSAMNCEEKGKLVQKQFPSVFRQLAAGLTYLHSENVVHGTLSPDEIVIKIGSAGQVSVKIAKLTFGQDGWGGPNSSEQDDVRRLGCVAYCIQSRDHPFGNPGLRLNNIRQKVFNLQNLSPVTYHLIWSMVDHAIPCYAVLFHPLFWHDWKVADFIQAAQYFFASRSEDSSNYVKQPLLQMWCGLQKHKQDCEEVGTFYCEDFDFPDAQ